MVSLTGMQETRRARLIALLVFAVAMGLGANGVAQTGGSGQSAGETASEDTGQAAGDQGGSDAQSEEDEDEGPDPSDPDYWSEIREVQTVQRRPFQKVNRFALSAYGGIVPNNIFEKYVPVGLRVNYFILENIGLELAGSYAIRSETSVEAVLSETRGAAANQVLVGDRQIGQVNFGIVWSPFYGKTTIGGLDIGYFDFYLVGGAGVIMTQLETRDAPDGGQVQAKPQGVVGAGLAYYFLDNAAVRLDYRQFIFQHVEEVGGVATPSEISLGASWFF
jgi:outer membrane beta-barrel protein